MIVIVVVSSPGGPIADVVGNMSVMRLDCDPESGPVGSGIGGLVTGIESWVDDIVEAPPGGGYIGVLGIVVSGSLEEVWNELLMNGSELVVGEESTSL